MAGRVRGHLSYANVMATIAVFVALGGSSYAAISVTGADIKNSSVTGRDLKNNSVTRKDVRNGTLTGGDVRDGSLLAGDFAPGQLPAGPPGPKGDPGVVDTSKFFTKAESDARFLAAGGKAADAAKLGGRGPEELRTISGAINPDGTSQVPTTIFTSERTGAGAYVLRVSKSLIGTPLPVVTVVGGVTDVSGASVGTDPDDASKWRIGLSFPGDRLFAFHLNAAASGD